MNRVKKEMNNGIKILGLSATLGGDVVNVVTEITLPEVALMMDGILECSDSIEISCSV